MTYLPEPFEPECGPAMKLLTEKRRAFVRGYVRRGMKNASAAYVEAGYTAANANVAGVEGHKLLHNHLVQSAIQEECVREFAALAPVAVRVVGELVDNPQVDAAVRQKVAFGILDRTGLHKVTEQKVTVEHIGDDPAKVARARMLMARLGISEEQAEKVFGTKLAGKVIEAEYVEVPPDEELNW